MFIMRWYDILYFRWILLSQITGGSAYKMRENICEMCGKKATIDNQLKICESCYENVMLYEAADYGIEIWLREAFGSRTKEYEATIDRVLARRVADISKKVVDKEEQEKQLIQILKEEIIARISFYRKDDFIATVLSVKEYLRRYILRTPQPEWDYINDISVINVLIRIAGESEEFENHPMGLLENGSDNFVNALYWARRYNLISNNLEIAKGTKYELWDMCCEAIQNDGIERYFERYLEDGKAEKIEDYVIADEALRMRLEKEKKTPKEIKESLEKILKRELGFEISDLHLIKQVMFEMEFADIEKYKMWVSGEIEIYEHYPIFVMDKQLLLDIIDSEVFESILDTFSINRNYSRREIEIELACFYEVGERIIFGNFDLLQTFSMFEKFLISNHFLDIYKMGLSKETKVVQAQKAMSKYFAYAVADVLHENGYYLPTEKYCGKQVIRAEIESIKYEGGDVLLDMNNMKLGDIDVLALDNDKKEILLIELKFFKPSLDYMDLLVRDRSQIIDELVHIKKREDAVKSRKKDVVKFILGECEEGYSVKSILLTARTNFYGLQQLEVQYYTWNEFIKKVKTKKI